MSHSLPLARANAFVLAKQHLAHAAVAPVVQVAGDVGGLHSTSSTAPYLSLAARLPAFARAQLDDELYQRHALVRLRCVRQTIYICPADWLPCLFAATAQPASAASLKFMQSRGISQDEYRRAAGRILELLSDDELSVEALKRALPGQHGLSEIVNLMCDEGLLVRGRPLKSWKDRRLQYAALHRWYPDIDLQAADQAEATAWLVERYLAAFGPATLADIVWWTGIAQGRVTAALTRLGSQVCQVSLAGSSTEHWLLRTEVEALAATRAARRPLVNALPELDGYAMGYKERGRWLDERWRPTIFDRGGNAAPVVLARGRAAGVWDYSQAERGLVKVHLFEPGEHGLQEQIEAEVRRVARAAADGRDVELKRCTAMTPVVKQTMGSIMAPLKDC